MDKEYVRNKYQEVGTVLSDALKNSKTIEIVGEEENEELEAIIDTLTSLSESFKQEIDKLENSSEWDKLCIAFFGETNAGKSTLIESMRIMYNEEERRREILMQKEEYINTLREHCLDYEKLLEELQELNMFLDAKKHKYDIRLKFMAALYVFIGFFLGCLVSCFNFI